MSLGTGELLLILILVLLLMGGTLIPKLVRSIGRSKQEFQEASGAGGTEDDA